MKALDEEVKRVKIWKLKLNYALEKILRIILNVNVTLFASVSTFFVRSLNIYKKYGFLVVFLLFNIYIYISRFY